MRTLSANCTGWREWRRQYPASIGVWAVSTVPVRLHTSGSVGAANDIPAAKDSNSSSTGSNNSEWNA